MQINTIAIDLTRCRHKLLVIKGDNGSGKTTLFNAISILPDDNSCFIPGMEASKKIGIYDDFNGTEYQVLFVHGIKKDGSRETTKGYISKLINGKYQEMNPNGNQSSFKDLVKLHLGIDQSYLALLRLGANVENLIDKTSADRKAYISSKVKDTEFYTLLFKSLKDEYRTFNAQSSILTNKLQSLSSDKYDDYRDALVTSNNDLITLNDQKETLIKTKYSYKSEIDKY